MSLAPPAVAPDDAPVFAHEADVTSVRAALRSPRRLRTEVLAGLVVALALIPEAISFSIIAGVDPRVGLFASFTMAVSIAFVGGRPAMISAATGAVALVVAPLVREHGLDYLVATVILGGVIQVVLGLLGVARLMRFVPRSVMVGFVNALAILIFLAQLPHLVGVPWLVYPLVAVGIVIMVVLPRLTTAVPAPLVAIVVLTVLTVRRRGRRPHRRRRGQAARQPAQPVPPARAVHLAHAGHHRALRPRPGPRRADGVAHDGQARRRRHRHPLLKTREAWGQGVANIVTGFFGGMGGCAMIGQTMINVKASGARTRISTFLAGVFLLILVVGLGDVVAVIPMAALVAVMIMVSVGTFDWHSIQPATLRRMPRSETLVMVATVAVVVATEQPRHRRHRRRHRRHGHVRPPGRPPHPASIDVAHPDEDTRVYAVERRAVLRLQQRPRRPVRLRRRPRRTSSSTCPAPTSGTPRPSPPSTPSRPSTPTRARP